MNTSDPNPLTPNTKSSPKNEARSDALPATTKSFNSRLTTVCKVALRSLKILGVVIATAAFPVTVVVAVFTREIYKFDKDSSRYPNILHSNEYISYFINCNLSILDG